MVTRFLTTLLVLSSTASAFVPKPKKHRSISGLILHEYEDKKGYQISFNPMEGYKSVNEKRAKECAETFGKCSVEEMASLRDNLHKERLQSMIFGNQGMVLTPTFLEHRLLEEDLDLQLHLLQEHETNLFPEVEAPMLELPHHKDHTLQKNAGHVAHKANIDLALVETIFEESVLETIAMCAVVVALILAPQVMQLS